MNNEEPEKSSLSLIQSTVKDVLSGVDGIPLPPVIKRNLWKSIGSLITGLFDVPVALLEAKSQQIRGEANALSLVTKTASEAAAIEFGQDKNLIDRSVNHFGSKLLRQQINREDTVKKAIEDLRENPPNEDSREEIDEDWLEVFSRIAETKSNQDVQLFLSKILSGEVREPGTFSTKTIQTLSLLDQKTAQVFQAFCNVSFSVPAVQDMLTCVIHESFGEPGLNGLGPLGLSYANLTILQDAGLMQYSLTSWRDIPSEYIYLPFTVGNTVYQFQVTEESPETVRTKVLNFTQVGIELRKVIHIDNNVAYNEKFVEWIIDKFKLSTH
jgi:hypothetical protein